MNPAHAPLQVRSVVKTFRQGSATIQALAGVNLDVAPGEFIAIMGASGSGKSTLLHAIAGLTRLDAGRILVNGQDLAALSDARLTRFRRRHIGLVFQAFNLVPSSPPKTTSACPLTTCPTSTTASTPSSTASAWPPAAPTSPTPSPGRTTTHRHRPRPRHRSRPAAGRRTTGSLDSVSDRTSAASCANSATNSAAPSSSSPTNPPWPCGPTAPSSSATVRPRWLPHRQAPQSRALATAYQHAVQSAESRS